MRPRVDLLKEIDKDLPAVVQALLHRHPVNAGDWEVTLVQARTMGTIAAAGECTMGQLARQLGISLSAASGLVDRLVQSGLLERQVCTHDRRQVMVRLAAAGQAVKRTLDRKRRRELSTALGGLETAELAQVAAGLALLRRAVEGEGGKSAPGT